MSKENEWSEYVMFKNKHIDGKCNRWGEQIAKLRKQLPDKTSQRILADRMQEKGIDMDKNAIQRIEHGDRFVTDIELAAFADFFGVSSDVLLGKRSRSIEMLSLKSTYEKCH